MSISSNQSQQQLPPQDLFFEVIHKTKHVFLEAVENKPASELRKELAAIFPELNFDAGTKLVRTGDNSDAYSTSEWIKINEEKTLAENGFSNQNARAHAPAQVAILFEGDTKPELAELSNPPPLPDSMMRPNDAQADN